MCKNNNKKKKDRHFLSELAKKKALEITLYLQLTSATLLQSAVKKTCAYIHVCILYYLPSLHVLKKKKN